MNTTTVKKFSKADAAIAKMKEEYSGLKVQNKEDIEGYDKVKLALKIVSGKRIEVENFRKKIKAKPLQECKDIDAEANRIKKLIAPLEDSLNSQKKIVDDHIAALKRKKDEDDRIALEQKNKELEAENKRMREVLEKNVEEANVVEDLFSEVPEAEVETKDVLNAARNQIAEAGFTPVTGLREVANAVMEEKLIACNRILDKLHDDRVVMKVNWYSAVDTVGIVVAMDIVKDIYLYIGVSRNSDDEYSDIKHILDHGTKLPFIEFYNGLIIPEIEL